VLATWRRSPRDCAAHAAKRAESWALHIAPARLLSMRTETVRRNEATEYDDREAMSYTACRGRIRAKQTTDR